jgi:hypothetical protein
MFGSLTGEVMVGDVSMASTPVVQSMQVHGGRRTVLCQAREPCVMHESIRCMGTAANVGLLDSRR